MVNVDSETGEILDVMTEDDEDRAAVPHIDFDEWGEDAHALLQAVDDGPHYRKKRRTLLCLAEAAYLNVSQASVFRRPDCASKVAHYKWRKEDPAYIDAYSYLVGTATSPGLARIHRERELDEDEALAVSSLVEARTRLRLASADAVRTLEEALHATDRFGALWRERIVAANSILDRADTDTAARTAPAVSLVDRAIMTVYATSPESPDQPSDGQPAALLPGTAEGDDASVIEGEATLIPSPEYSHDEPHMSEAATADAQELP